tara:strand:+ start:448 stop:762 length:315 start_codon:yes stop_codon:yes gene_type:complete
MIRNQKRLSPEWYEFLKITTVGPAHLQLNADLRQTIYEAAQEEEKEILTCQCGKAVLVERKGNLVQLTRYYLIDDNYYCRDCSPWCDDIYFTHFQGTSGSWRSD